MTNWTEKDLAALQDRHGTVSRAPVLPRSQPAPPSPAKPLARGQMSPRKMNATEKAYNDHLWLLRHAGEVAWHDFEAVKLRLADDTYYIPDFIVMLADGAIQFHECKGFMRDDAAVKLKVAARMFPCFRFVLAWREAGQWRTQEVEP